jgi:hypothetical protein
VLSMDAVPLGNGGDAADCRSQKQCALHRFFFSFNPGRTPLLQLPISRATGP